MLVLDDVMQYEYEVISIPQSLSHIVLQITFQNNSITSIHRYPNWVQKLKSVLFIQIFYLGIVFSFYLSSSVKTP